MKVYLVGAGPGDPGLLTIKGRELLARADVILHDHLASDAVLDYASPAAERAGARGDEGGDEEDYGAGAAGGAPAEPGVRGVP